MLTDVHCVCAEEIFSRNSSLLGHVIPKQYCIILQNVEDIHLNFTEGV